MDQLKTNWAVISAADVMAANPKNDSRISLLGVWLSPVEGEEAVHVRATQGHVLWSHKIMGSLSKPLFLPASEIAKVGGLKPSKKQVLIIESDDERAAIIVKLDTSENRTEWKIDIQSKSMPDFQKLFDQAAEHGYDPRAEGVSIGSHVLDLVVKATKKLDNPASRSIPIRWEFPTESERPLTFFVDEISLLVMPMRSQHDKASQKEPTAKAA